MTKKILKALKSQVEDFMIKEMNAGASLPKLEKWEKDWAAWKIKNGYHLADDCEYVCADIEEKLKTI